ncbi:hypothetical protein BLNAU_8199 [Blattamonas nauphoetae]|uniref:Uncharacterized protein n=1 Tax=Blattamonas nauphoetae TaxID=2049346 RepID=A0ABQ9XZ39_9EUKA|nr:hypothetical protein BLNAU_8199 [Blattamonas nauphoetae]
MGPEKFGLWADKYARMAGFARMAGCAVTVLRMDEVEITKQNHPRPKAGLCDVKIRLGMEEVEREGWGK